MIDNNIYRFNIQKLNGEEVSLADYKDKVLLIVNTASQCGFTPQLQDLAALKMLKSSIKIKRVIAAPAEGLPCGMRI